MRPASDLGCILRLSLTLRKWVIFWGVNPGVHNRAGLTVCFRFASGLALELNADGLMDDAIQDGVGVSGIAYSGVPAVDRDLSGQNDGAAIMPIVDDLHEIAALRGGQICHGPVVQDQEIDLDHLAHQAAHPIAEPGDGKVIKQPRQARVEHAVAFSGGLIAQGACDPAFARAGGPGNDQMAALADARELPST